ncbi:MAG: hypothetical protein WCK59_04205 [Candidatus Falkowbacteria bacterium]
MKSIQLIVKNSDNSCWITFEKEDTLLFLLPLGTIFEAVENYCGAVVSHYYNEKDSKFVTNIEVTSILRFQLEYFREELLKNGWVIKYEDKYLIFRDGCK